MKMLPLAVFLWAAGAAAAERLPDMTPGRYEVRIEGLLCRTCTRAIVEELTALKEVQTAVQNFDHEGVLITVRPGLTLTVYKLRNALDRAARRVNLGTRFKAVGIKYLV